MIFSQFDELKDNDALVLVSDHSLLPLKKLFQKERGGLFEWNLLAEGPEEWKTEIKKIGIQNITINDLLRWYPGAFNVFEDLGISYYTDGNKKLSEVYQNSESAIQRIRANKCEEVEPRRFDDWTISFTIDYIIHNHHTYVRRLLKELETIIDHLEVAHAATHPQLPMVKKRFLEFRKELVDHMKDEERKVFPSMKKLDQELSNEGRPENTDAFVNAISWMEEDHILTGSSLKSLRNYCNNYEPPPDSSPGFKLLFEELKKFERDMHFHMYLENNILFRKVDQAINSKPEV